MKVFSIIILFTVSKVFSFWSPKLISNSWKNMVTLKMSATTPELINAVHSPVKSESDILIRAYRGEVVERTPVWLMRQAGRYMADFRKFSEKYKFRERSENPEIAIELSLQPWRSFGLDGVILFSDILTPLPALGIDFSIIEGKGPKIAEPIRSQEQIDLMKPLHDIHSQIPFIKPILQSLRKETEGKTSLIGFIGAPWTIAAYSVEGGHSKLCTRMKRMCLENPQMATSLLDKLTDALGDYACYQIECGAQILQIFESWSHHLSEEQWIAFAKPYANKIATKIKEKYPHVPVVYFANGGSGYLHSQLDMNMNGWSVDWKVSMSTARAIAGPNTVLAGNVDPMVLMGSEKNIIAEVKKCISQAGKHHVLNLGHGVEKETPESSVAAFVNAAKEAKLV